MIEEVLELIVDGKMVDKREIAKEVGVQIETLDHIIDLLCQNGYLRLSENSCTHSLSCSGCSMADSCGSSDKLGKVLIVTEKGKQLVIARRKRGK